MWLWHILVLILSVTYCIKEVQCSTSPLNVVKHCVSMSSSGPSWNLKLSSCDSSSNGNPVAFEHFLIVYEKKKKKQNKVGLFSLFSPWYCALFGRALMKKDTKKRSSDSLGYRGVMGPGTKPGPNSPNFIHSLCVKTASVLRMYFAVWYKISQAQIKWCNTEFGIMAFLQQAWNYIVTSGLASQHCQ